MILEPEDYLRLIEKVGDSAQTVIPLHFLLTGQATVLVDDPENLGNVVIRADSQHPMVFCYGDDMGRLLPLLREAGRTRQLWAPAEFAEDILATAREAYEIPLRMHRVEQKTVSRAPSVPQPEDGIEVRRLDPEDAALMRNAPEELQWLREGWGTWERQLREGIIVAAVRGLEVVSAAVTFGRSLRHDDIGVATSSGRQSKGLCTACGAGIAAAILSEGRVPVWTVAVDNHASFRVSEKLGFAAEYHAVGICPEAPAP